MVKPFTVNTLNRKRLHTHTRMLCFKIAGVLILSFKFFTKENWSEVKIGNVQFRNIDDCTRQVHTGISVCEIFFYWPFSGLL